MLLLLLAVAEAALMTDFANVYYCPEGYCLNKKEGVRMAGPASMFRECQMEGAEPTAVSTWNYYRTNNLEVDFGDMWKMEEGLKDAPKTNGEHVMAPCCEGYKSEQCKAMAMMEEEEEAQNEDGCCYNMGFGAMYTPCCQKAHEVMMAEEDGLVAFSQCPVKDTRMGGATKFAKGMTCEQMEAKEWADPLEGAMCCAAVTASCESCKYGVSKETYCEAYPQTDGCGEEPRMCCEAIMASCEACKAGMTEEEYCKKNPTMMGCEEEEESEEGCCYNMGFGSMMKPCCQAAHPVMQGDDDGLVGFEQCPVKARKMGGATKFAKGMTCDQMEDNKWADPLEGTMCCEAMTATCESCKYGVSVKTYCKAYPDMDGCESDEPVCCEAMTASCEACKAKMPVEDYCAKFPFIDGCKGMNKCMDNADCTKFEKNVCDTGSCTEGQCFVATIACDQPICKDGSRPDPIPGTCCQFEECPGPCKKDKQCTYLTENEPCGTAVCMDGQCGMNMIMCDMPPPCDNGNFRESIPNTCCGFYDCDWNKDPCSIPGAGKSKKKCKEASELTGEKCVSHKPRKACMALNEANCNSFKGDKKGCKKFKGCKYMKKGKTCSMK